MSELIIDTENIYTILCAKGRRFDLGIELTNDDDSDFDLTGFTFRMVVRKNPEGPVFLTFEEGDGLTIEGNELIFYKQSIDLIPASYCYDIVKEDEEGSENIMKGAFNVVYSIS